jgi:hypothetical protein
VLKRGRTRPYWRRPLRGLFYRGRATQPIGFVCTLVKNIVGFLRGRPDTHRLHLRQRGVQARLYNKTLETKERANEAYAALLIARNGDAYDPAQEVWRLEFELKRDGAKGFKLYAAPEQDDDEAAIEAELAAEELEHIGTLPRFFARMDELFAYLTLYWLRFVEDNGTANRSRWPLHPTWAQLRVEFARLAQEQAQPLDEDQRALVRGSRYQGKARILRRMQLGVLSSLELEDASPVSASLLALQRWVERIAEREMARITAKCERYAAQGKAIPRWVW